MFVLCIYASLITYKYSLFHLTHVRCFVLLQLASQCSVIKPNCSAGLKEILAAGLQLTIP